MTGGFWTLLLVELVGIVLLRRLLRQLRGVMAEQFPPEVRTTGIGLPTRSRWRSSAAPPPYITTWLAERPRDLVWVYVAAPR